MCFNFANNQQSNIWRGLIFSKGSKTRETFT